MPATTLIALLLPIVASIAQRHQEPILSCVDVSCPYNGSYDTCTVAKDRFLGIGLVPISSPYRSLSGIYLIKGVGHARPDADTTHATNNSDSSFTHTLSSTYYLGTPPSLNVSALSGCSVVFHETEGGLSFVNPEKRPGIEWITDTCPDVISQDCIRELQTVALQATKDTQSCQPLDQMLRTTVPKSCAHFAGPGRGLGRYTVADASHLSPITQAENSTSDCWPMLPKEGQLSHITSDQVIVSAQAQDMLEEMHKITPILTVLRNEGMKEKSAELSCVKMIYGYDPERPGMVGNIDDS